MRWLAALAVVIAGPAWARSHGATVSMSPEKCARTFLNDALRLPAGSRLGLPPGCSQLAVPARFDVRQTAHGTEIWLGARQVATFVSPVPPPPVPTTTTRTQPVPHHAEYDPCGTHRRAGGAEFIDVHSCTHKGERK